MTAGFKSVGLSFSGPIYKILVYPSNSEVVQKKKKDFMFFNINISILNSKEFKFYEEPKINTVSDFVFLKNRTTAQQINFLLPMGKHNIAFCRNIAVGILGGRGIEYRQLSEQDFNRGFSGVEGDRHLPIIIIVATPIFLQM